MITGNFVSCYSCAGEGSDLNHGSVWRGRGGMGCWFPSQLSCAIQAEPVPELEAQVLYSLIIFQNYTAITFKNTELGVDLVAGMGEARDFWGRWGEGMGCCRVEEGFWEGSPHRLSDKHYKFEQLTVVLFKKFGKRKERM